MLRVSGRVENCEVVRIEGEVGARYVRGHGTVHVRVVGNLSPRHMTYDVL
jgi:hypothetical protein